MRIQLSNGGSASDITYRVPYNPAGSYWLHSVHAVCTVAVSVSLQLIVEDSNGANVARFQMGSTVIGAGTYQVTFTDAGESLDRVNQQVVAKPPVRLEPDDLVTITDLTGTTPGLVVVLDLHEPDLGLS